MVEKSPWFGPLTRRRLRRGVDRVVERVGVIVQFARQEAAARRTASSVRAAPPCDHGAVDDGQTGTANEIPTTTEVTPDPVGVTLTGTVSTASGRPLSDATVSVLGLDGAAAAVATTDEKGAYRVDGLTGAVYAVAAQRLPHRPGAALLSVSGGPAVVDLVLVGRGSLSGKVVTGRDRIALVDVPVRLLGADGWTAASAFSGVDGSYLFDNVDEGPWTVAVQSPRYSEAHVAVIAVADSDIVADVVLAGSGAVRGQLTSPGPTPLAGSRVLLLDSDGKVCDNEITDSFGTYSFDDVPTGIYSVVVLDLTPTVGSVTVTAGDASICDLGVREVRPGA